jgi:hypothetical protein
MKRIFNDEQIDSRKIKMKIINLDFKIKIDLKIINYIKIFGITLHN